MKVNRNIPGRTHNSYLRQNTGHHKQGTIVLAWTTIVVFLCMLITACKEKEHSLPSTYVHLDPSYEAVHLQLLPDTIHFALGNNTFNDIKSFNYFEHKGKQFISFYDRRSESVNIYDLTTRQQVQRILLKKTFGGKALFKGSVYVKSPDSIIITNKQALYLLNRDGNAVKKVKFFDRIDAMALLGNAHPAIVKADTLYTAVRPYISDESTADIRKWKLVYQFDLEKEDKDLTYSLPPLYTEGLYGEDFFEYNYCYNDKGNFVFSFPADTTIYETDLAGYHRRYYGKSKFQSGPILPVSKEDLLNDQGRKQYAIRDSYGYIFFDPLLKRYLRMAKQKITAAEYDSKKGSRKQSLLIFDEHFRVIGESSIPNDLSLKSLFITGDGKMYIRTNYKDEHALHFIRLGYLEQAEKPAPLALTKHSN